MAIDPRFFTYGGQALEDLGTGLAQGGFKNMFGQATQVGQQLQPYRQQQLENKLALERDKDKVAKAAEALRKQGFGDLADGVAAESLDTSSAWNEAFKRMSPDYKLDAEYKRAQIAALGQKSDALTEVSPGATLYDPSKGTGVYTAPTAASSSPQTPPSGYRWSQDGNLEFIPNGPADPSTAGKTTEATRRNQQLASVIEPEVQALIGDGQHPGTFDALANGSDQARDAAGGLAMGIGQGPSPEYQQAKNSLRTIIASYLYSVSGATANPGEVENQAAVLTPKFGEDPKSVADKKRRIQVMVDAVRAAATGTPINIDAPASPGGGFKILSVSP